MNSSQRTRLRLLLLPVHFPYGRGEEFLEAEITYLAQQFDITIIPLALETDYASSRPLPENVRADAGIAQSLPRTAGPTLAWFLRHPGRLLTLLKLAWQERHSLFHPARGRQFIRFASQAVIFAVAVMGKRQSAPADIIYSYWLNQEALAGTLLKNWGLARTVVSRAHGGDLYADRTTTGYLPAQAQMVAGLDEIICISEHGARYLREKHPEHSAKITLSRLGVSPAPAPNMPPDDGRLHLVSCAYLAPVKRIHLLVEALALCEFPITWTHLGGGETEELLRQQAGALPPNIQWRITGNLAHGDILRFYQQNPVSLFINVSASEGLPVSIMEAMSYGIPVAATDVGGNSELVRDGETGLLMPSNPSPEEIANRLRQFYRLPDEKKQAMREAAWRTWRDEVNATVQFPAFAQHLIDLLQSKTT